MNLPNETMTVVTSSLNAWAAYTMRENDETLAQSSTFQYANNGKKRKNSPPRARKYAKWIKTTATRNQPGPTVIEYKPNPEMSLICDVIEFNLQELHQRVLVMKFIEGRNAYEIAEAVSKSRTAVDHILGDIYVYFAGILRLKTIRQKIKKSA